MYPEDKPLFEITAANMDKYADKLSEGQKAMFKRFPETFRMPVYQSRRDFRYPDVICEVARKNALEAELIDGGLGYTGYKGPIGFPIPKEPMEVLANMNFPYRAFTEHIVRDIADVSSDGSITWGRQVNKNLNVVTSPDEIGKPMEGLMAYSLSGTLLPERDRGSFTASQEPVNFAKAKRLAWQYDPGTRRVRQLPTYGFDSPLGGTSGKLTIDQDRLMNGDPSRYEWKLHGKKEMYIPANAYRIHSKDVKYADLLTKITGEAPTVVLSDDPGASARISQFSEDTSRWMVAVRMVSEGVDVPRLAVGVYATSASTPLFFAQAIGRFVRSRRPGETASIFLPSVPNLLLLASEMEAQRNHVLGKPHRESEGLDDEALDAAEKRKDEKSELEHTFESLGADAELDQVIFDGSSFGTATPAGRWSRLGRFNSTGRVNAPTRPWSANTVSCSSVTRSSPPWARWAARVDLPAPFSPMMPSDSPRPTVKLMSCSTSHCGKRRPSRMRPNAASRVRASPLRG